MENRKALNLIGMGKKAGYVAVGETASVISINKKKAKLIILANDASENTFKKFQNLSKSKEIKIFIVFSKSELGSILGKEYVSTITINDENFSKAILNKLVK